VNRILIVRTSSLGDIVHGLPAVAALRHAYPSSRIDWVVDARHAALLELVPIVNRRIVIGGTTLAEGGRAGLMSRLAGFRETLRELKSQHYDIAIDLQGLLRSAMIARWSGASRVVGFDRSRLREPIAHRFYKETFNPASPPGAHVVFKNLGLVAALGVPATDVEFPLERRDSATVRAVLEGVHARGGGRFVLVNPGAGWPNKRWPPERFGALARVLRDGRGMRSVVLWGPGEEPLARAVAGASAGAADVAPATSLSDLVALASKAALFIAGDTGPLHVAAAVGTPVVGIYGPTNPARTGSWRASDVMVSRHPRCRCVNLRACRVDEWCLGDIDVSEVARAAGSRLEAAGTDA
jgi:lipopolysaccharide heptosyltransferase I